ncbi:F0F1 ATP synthase subunit B [Fimbriiglobus ruber]|uniref:ATP synthase subunit b n=1 Tax=Fimbriiglobus ruber TaxID=1908690 RepID=A0A225D6Y5_9BACT|nr:F0F1 ATP synthase subunit B [Fimbriiglobus ruber]OWK37360.1 ATP synthase F0 sector subunit b [Fimbriiglobus ruber]
MTIDWFTVAAEAVNFLILAWLLKRFLYRPILAAIDARETGIATRLAQAAAKEAEANKQRDDFQHKNAEFDQQRGALFGKVTDEAGAERKRLIDAARAKADALRTKRREALQAEEKTLAQEIVRQTQREIFAISRKALADLAAASLEERMTDVFVRRLRELNGDEKTQLAAILRGETQGALVRSAFDLPPAQRAAIEGAIRETLAAGAPVRFETVPALLGGIELTASGHKVAWSIADYLTSLEKKVGELVESDPSQAAKQGANGHAG